MKNTLLTAFLAASTLIATGNIRAETITGTVSGPAGKPVGGVMISAFDKGHRKFVSVFSQEDGSFVVDGLRNVKHDVRARLMGFDDEWSDGTRPGTAKLRFKTQGRDRR